MQRYIMMTEYLMLGSAEIDVFYVHGTMHHITNEIAHNSNKVCATQKSCTLSRYKRNK